MGDGQSNAGESDVDIADRLDRLEALVENQQATIETQQERIEEQAETIRNRLNHIEVSEGGNEGMSLPVTRRQALQAGGVLGLLGVGVGTASAAPSGTVGVDGTPVKTVYTSELGGPLTGGNIVDTLDGDGLEISAGQLQAAGSESHWQDAENNRLEPADDNVTGIEIDRITDNGSGAVAVGNLLSLDGNNVENVGDIGIDTATINSLIATSEMAYSRDALANIDVHTMDTFFGDDSLSWSGSKTVLGGTVSGVTTGSAKLRYEFSGEPDVVFDLSGYAPRLSIQIDDNNFFGSIPLLPAKDVDQIRIESFDKFNGVASAIAWTINE